MSSGRRTQLLAGALGLLLLIFAWQRWVPSLGGGSDGDDAAPQRNPGSMDALEDDTGDRATARPARRRSNAPDAGIRDRVVALNVDDLEPRAGEFESGRNPFAFFLPPPPPPPPPPGPTPEELEARRRAEDEAAKPKPPPIPYTYLGRFGPRNRPIAVLAEGEAIHNVLLGDVLDGKFRLVEIGYESIELEYVDFPDVPAARLPVGAEGT
jgi:hypothetical protein